MCENVCDPFTSDNTILFIYISFPGLFSFFVIFIFLIISLQQNVFILVMFQLAYWRIDGKAPKISTIDFLYLFVPH